MPVDTFADAGFQEELAEYLEKCSMETVKRFSAKAFKAGTTTYECRDTGDPAMVSSLLMTLVEVFGERIYPPALGKRVRDDVCWQDGEELPWRRSARWLVLRVGLLRHLTGRVKWSREQAYDANDDSELVGKIMYKFLMCTVLCRLLMDAIHQDLPSEYISVTRAKLGRRLAKLEKLRVGSSVGVSHLYKEVFDGVIVKPCREALKLATTIIDKRWAVYKKTICKTIPILPTRATQNDLVLSMPNSRQHLEEILKWDRENRTRQFHATNSFPMSKTTQVVARQGLQKFSQPYFQLAELECKIERSDHDLRFFTVESACTRLEENIKGYVELTMKEGLYAQNPEQNSIMILRTLELWMQFDMKICQMYQLVSEYHPVFEPDALNALVLSRFHDLERLAVVQSYISGRIEGCERDRQMNMFADPVEGCFGQQYFERYDHGRRMHKVLDTIEAQAEAAKSEKKKEWARKNQAYQDRRKKIAEESCVWKQEGAKIIHDFDKCTKCFLQRQNRRTKINIHEHPLPKDPSQAKCVVFELLCPQAIRQYRNSVWLILAMLSDRSVVPERIIKENASTPMLMLSSYTSLSNSKYGKMAGHGVTLASTTKTFTGTHYRELKFPTSVESVCVPNGLKLRYYDVESAMWTGPYSTIPPAFAHLCHMIIPTKSLFAPLQHVVDRMHTGDFHGLSSNEVLAAQGTCPLGVSFQEFMAFQNICSGINRHWVNVLIELGSTNLNFSKEETALLLSHISGRVGPANGLDPYRNIFQPFQSESFQAKLHEQISQRLQDIKHNWRESHAMHSLLTLILRLDSLTSKGAKSTAKQLLGLARAITLDWVRRLRSEILRPQEADTIRPLARYAVWAAVLCRWTFVDWVDEVDNSGVLMDYESLRCFLECSIILQENFEDGESLMKQDQQHVGGQPLLKQALLCNMKMTWRLRKTLLESIKACPRAMTDMIDAVWKSEGTSKHNYINIQFPTEEEKKKRGMLLDAGGHESGSIQHECWIKLQTQASQAGTKEQSICYNLVEGSLLIDDKPLGRLPEEFRSHVMLNTIFGTKVLLVQPARLKHMHYKLAHEENGHIIYIGFRGRDLIVQAHRRDNMVFEFVHHSRFGTLPQLDLPSTLIDDCVHWLNITTQELQVRQRKDIWSQKMSYWAIDLPTMIARRNKSFLINPHSILFAHIASVFCSIERKDHLTIYIGKTGIIHIELRRLQLMFEVTAYGKLYSQELASFVDEDQDAQTWYGLESKLVLRDDKGMGMRSILVPLGPPKYKLHEGHVNVSLEHSGDYARFFINTTLGRIDCATEPRILIHKAMLHAFTSSLVPDQLTGRTGTEEAVHCLKSGNMQPWSPLNPAFYPILEAIAKLTPSRVYYPLEMKQMQRVIWDENLTTAIQHEAFAPIIVSILERSHCLSLFVSAQQMIADPTLPERGVEHLRRRGYLRRRLYERRLVDYDKDIENVDDVLYHSRDKGERTKSCQHVFETVQLLKSRPAKLQTTSNLAALLSYAPIIRGFRLRLDNHNLSELIELDLVAEWGALVGRCIQNSSNSLYEHSFLMGVIAFRDSINMELIRVLIAFSILPELKKLDTPPWDFYSEFKNNQNPTAQSIEKVLSEHLLEYEPTFIGDQQIKTSEAVVQERKRLNNEMKLHAKNGKKQINELAKALLAQWPCVAPNMSVIASTEAQSSLIDVPSAMQTLIPQWERLYHNLGLSRYLKQVQAILGRAHEPKDCLTLQASPIKYVAPLTGLSSHYKDVVSMEIDLLQGPFKRDKKPVEPHESEQNAPASGRHLPVTASKGVSPQADELSYIIKQVCNNSNSTVYREYGNALNRSLVAFNKVQARSKPEQLQTLGKVDAIRQSHYALRSSEDSFAQLRSVLTRQDDPANRWLCDGGLFPSITRVGLLEQLRSTSKLDFGDRMWGALVDFAVKIANYQRLLRIKNAYLAGKDVSSEHMSNQTHKDWDPSYYPDWLLLEIESNITIRPDQVQVARAIINPSSGSNSVLQMNMGQGKTSIIIPMVASVLADTERLVRIVVPKPLLLQTAQIMQARLGGLLGRTISHVPYSRKVSTAPNITNAYVDVHKRSMRSAGVMITLPEHIMSFSLSGLQRMADSKRTHAVPMIEAQKWINSVSRDILDECDALLAVRTQLIYPSGAQTIVDGHPHRWKTAQEVLRIVREHVVDLQRTHPKGIEVIWRDENKEGRFPLFSLLRSDVEKAIIRRIVEEVMMERAVFLPIETCTPTERLAIQDFIRKVEVDPKLVKVIHGMRLFKENSAAKASLLVLRGLLAHRILLMALNKRWNVQYGLHPARAPIAVPYHSKGVPSEQAEWGHPDVAILFTCLSFYLGGLKLFQLKQTLQHLGKSDDPASQYGQWIDSTGSSILPDSLRDWNLININDDMQMTALCRVLQHNMTVINYFLNNFVFPRHAKQFSTKIQASGWDVPLVSFSSSSTDQPSSIKPLTTGFSGTNDNRTMLPLTIKQDDLLTLEHTNAEVLTYTLQHRNRGYFHAAIRGTSKRMSEKEFVRTLCTLGIRILIDAGAHILEMSNDQLVATWLDVDNPTLNMNMNMRPGEKYRSAKAALYFDNDKPMIMYRNEKKKVPLAATPFVDDLSECLVYIDEAHTRGTDLKLPLGAKGALTLGLGQTKDQVVQGM